MDPVENFDAPMSPRVGRGESDIYMAAFRGCRTRATPLCFEAFCDFRA